MEHAKLLGDTYFDPARIHLMNNAIREITQKRSITLIDANAAFAGPDGDMPRNMTPLMGSKNQLLSPATDVLHLKLKRP